jgi:hypothetical protein
MTLIQKLAWAYALGFIFVVSLGYIPGFTDDAGLLFGLFKIDPIDDVVHTASGIWAAYAAWKSVRHSVFYFRAFGLFYSLDAVAGLIRGWSSLDVGTNLAVNLPHIIIGGFALLVGFVLAKRYIKD